MDVVWSGGMCVARVCGVRARHLAFFLVVLLVKYVFAGLGFTDPFYSLLQTCGSLVMVLACAFYG